MKFDFSNGKKSSSIISYSVEFQTANTWTHNKNIDMNTHTQIYL